MNGLEIARAYYEECGRPMLEEQFPELLPLIAVCFTGRGSEHYGYDDEISRDHDFEPGFCIFLPGEDIVDRRTAFRLERAYAKLPKEFCGVKRQPMSPVGGNRHGVMRTADFWLSAVGEADGALDTYAWLHIPDYALAEAVNGEIFYDNYGEFTRIREGLKHMPRDILLKRLAGNLLIMAQAGQYNFSRCHNHGEHEAAQLACNEFVTAAMKSAFLLSGRYMPYYKWSFRAMREFDPELADMLSFLLLSDNSSTGTAAQKQTMIERICAKFISRLQENQLTDAICGDLEKHAYSVNDHIADGEIRNMHIMTAV